MCKVTKQTRSTERDGIHLTGWAVVVPEALYRDQSVMGNVQPELQRVVAQYKIEHQEWSRLSYSAQKSFSDASGSCKDKLQALKRLSKVRS